MKIRKKEQSFGILGKIINSLSQSKNDTYSCDYINKHFKPVVLWEDTTNGWESGDITLNDDITNYRFVVIVTKGAGTYIICPILPKEMSHNNGATGYVRGVGGYYSGSNVITYHFAGTYSYASPNVLTFVGCNNVYHSNNSNHNAYANSSPIRIIGVK